MPFMHYRPSPPLSSFVEMFWYYEGEAGSPHKKERLLPQGSAELVINLREDEVRLYNPKDIREAYTLSGSAICGPHSQFFVIDTAEQDCVAGVHFRPGGLFPFFRLPASELHNQHVSMADLWGRAAAIMRERLLAEPTPSGKLRRLESIILEQVAKPLERHRAVNYALVRLGGELAAVGDLSGEIGISTRRLVDVFSAQVGITPKLFGRVQRFQKAIQTLPADTQVDWIQVALDCGYYDQAHFIHDFRSFSGLSPGQYLRLRTKHTNHIPIYED